MKPAKIQFVQVPPYGDELGRMQTFARSFDHEIDPVRNGHVFAFKEGETIFGYADVWYLPIAFPAFHPKLTTPRRVLGVVDGWNHHCQFHSGGEGLIGVPLTEDRKTFPTEMIVKRGFEQLRRELYAIKN